MSILNAPSNPPGSSGPSTSTTPGPSLAKEKKRKHHLTPFTDPLFSELRDLNFASVGKRLNRVARKLDEDYKVRHGFSAESITASLSIASRRLGIKLNRPRNYASS